jgi:hypothetical protein
MTECHSGRHRVHPLVVQKEDRWELKGELPKKVECTRRCTPAGPPPFQKKGVTKGFASLE